MANPRRVLTQRTPSRVLPLGYHAFLPEGRGLRPPIVIVHGHSRGAGRHFRAFLPKAIAANLPLVVPTFGDERFRGYQQLAGADGPMAAQEALTITLEDASTVLGVDTRQVDFLGFSGGAQFVHRFALASPHRVRRAVIAAAGWYTYLDSERPFPYGCAPSPASGHREFDVQAFLRLPMHVLIGERDVRRDASLRTGTFIDRRQGSDRLSRALRWIDHVEAVARAQGLESSITFDLLPASGHSFSEAVHKGGLVERTYDFLVSDENPSFGSEGASQ